MEADRVDSLPSFFYCKVKNVQKKYHIILCQVLRDTWQSNEGVS